MHRARSLFLVLALTLTALAGCVEDATPPTTADGADGNPPDGGTPVDPGDAEVIAFNGSRAFAYADEQVHREDGSVRYRVPGTPGNTEAAGLIATHLESAGWDVAWHHFNATYGCEDTPMHNVVGTLPGATDRVFYVGAHYDTRPIAEKDPDPKRSDEPIHGANDGASGVGVLLELARVLGARAAEAPLNATVKLVFFDGEDGGGFKGDECTDWILGSTAFVADLPADEIARADGMILVDLVGDAEAVFPREGYSAEDPHDALGDRVWGIANGLGFERFTNATSWRITDDHIPFQRAGIPAVDIIDLRSDGGVFPDTHHTHADTMENVSPVPLMEVGRTVERYLVETY